MSKNEHKNKGPKYRKISPRIWNDQKFYSASLSCQHLFLFILTHPHMSAIGAMRASKGGLADELDWREKGFPEAFEEAFAEGLDKGFWKHDRRAKFLVAPKFIRYNPPESPNVVVAWKKSLDDLPDCSLKNDLIHMVSEFLEGYGEGFQKAFPKPSTKTMANQEQEQEQYKIKTNMSNSDELDDGLFDSASEEPEHTPTKGPPNCPWGKIVDLYHETLPGMRRVMKPRFVGSASEKNLRARWREHTAHQDLGFWREFFEIVKTNPWWVDGTDQSGKKAWDGASFHWLVKRSNFDKVIERGLALEEGKAR